MTITQGIVLYISVMFVGFFLGSTTWLNKYIGGRTPEQKLNILIAISFGWPLCLLACCLIITIEHICFPILTKIDIYYKKFANFLMKTKD